MNLEVVYCQKNDLVNLIKNYSQTYTQWTLCALRILSTISFSEENGKRVDNISEFT